MESAGRVWPAYAGDAGLCKSPVTNKLQETTNLDSDFVASIEFTISFGVS